ncbi:dephospho-CoA kinase [Pseudoduganella sp. UC29_106]|uniref:dephospho-CoA kinase n=1 Tax=Pseudoduganella sp. UC29_106 TaxID=3374553 RepID=UPI0037571044
MSGRFTVGLTGGIGSGKSVVARLFADRGVSIVDTDQIARGLTIPGGAAMPDIIAEFGADMADAQGAMDRAKMRELVFREPDAKRRLEAILHPRIREAVAAAAAIASGPYTIFDVPLLVESGSWKDRVDRVLVVDCPEEVQVARVMARNNLPEDQVRAIMAAQVPRTTRLAAADDIVNNGGQLEDLPPQIERLHQLYLDFSKRKITIR